MEDPCCVLGSADPHITPSHGSAEGVLSFSLIHMMMINDDVGDDGDYDKESANGSI